MNIRLHFKNVVLYYKGLICTVYIIVNTIVCMHIGEYNIGLVYQHYHFFSNLISCHVLTQEELPAEPVHANDSEDVTGDGGRHGDE